MPPRGNFNNRGGGQPAQNGRGRGRGGPRGRGRGRGNAPAYDLSREMDFMVQMYPDNVGVNRGGYAAPGFRGRGIGSPVRGYESPPRGRGRGRGDFDSPGRGRGRGGRGRGGPKLRPDAPLSKLIYEERPFLRPIKFVPSVHHATLFQAQEELMQSLVEDVGPEEQSHVPTADRVARIFSGGNIPRVESEDEQEEVLEEIDFEDLAKLQEQVDSTGSAPTPGSVEVVEERFTGFYINKPTATVEPQAVELPSTVQKTEITTEQATTLAVETVTVVEDHLTVEDAAPLFYIDTTPTPVALAPGSVESALAPLDAYPSPDDEIIVYVAPHPRAGRTRTPSPVPAPILRPSLFTTTQPIESTSASVSFTFTPKPKTPRKQAPVFTAHGAVRARTKARSLAKRVERRATKSTFGSLGAKLAEARLRGNDPRRDERRMGDSDIDWGDSDEENEDEHGMEVDPELEFDAPAMKRFVMGMGQQGGQFVTMDDIEDERRMREEDEEALDVQRGSSGEEESELDEAADAIVNAEEDLLVGETGGQVDELEDEVDELEDDSEEGVDELEDDSDDDHDLSPKTGFQARLERLRKAARERGPDDSVDLMEGEESSDEDDFLERTWADRDEDLIEEIQAFLDDNGDIIAANSRAGRKKLLKAVANGEIIDFAEFSPAKKGKNKRKDIPAELQDIWDRDRAKKAENKRRRALERLELAADPLAHHKGGKKGRKAMLAAARTDPTITVLPNRVIDMTTLVQQIRRFVGDIGGPVSMSLPPTDKATRKNIHEMAIAFNLKSVSKGKGDSRYTTLTKTTRTGLRVDERKVGKLARRGGDGRGGAAFGRDEVGKAAPKIGQSNIGFKMLALMGWSEGDRIGASADGLHVPVTAVIKNTKLGLGATR
ncbi:hypothetical protein FB45DRAFT_992151 [Roridomyces roridus]|uniref:Protein SQS1 n=1 Tax=Roridomyces roridus TaxID=1738132 RepID=A0AAD7BHK2_9AGAR|nr:hypothetical protein FB45DRAFT_992151 [Roridomyces roridus]